jgi:hypothetical protein
LDPVLHRVAVEKSGPIDGRVFFPYFKGEQDGMIAHFHSWTSFSPYRVRVAPSSDCFKLSSIPSNARASENGLFSCLFGVFPVSKRNISTRICNFFLLMRNLGELTGLKPLPW